MNNKIKKEALHVLANAPRIAAGIYIKTLTNDQDKQDALRLFEALNVLKKTDSNLSHN